MEKALNKSSKNYELEIINSVMAKYIKVFQSMYMYVKVYMSTLLLTLMKTHQWKLFWILVGN